jgi:phosphoribosylaminoimidazole-succinocarboxamide synthase
VTGLTLLASGKVRELYELGDDLLMVASDRISTYDVVHPTPIPDKGRVLTALSVLWFDLTRDIVPNHLISATEGVPDEFRGRGLRVKRPAHAAGGVRRARLPVRSGWKDYQATGRVSGIELPPACASPSSCPSRSSRRRRRPTKGHDEAIDFEQAPSWPARASWPSGCATRRSPSTARSPTTRARAGSSSRTRSSSSGSTPTGR